MDVCRNLPMDEALSNSLILSRMLSYLDLKVLKLVRQVHPFWLEVCRPHFLKLAWVKLNPHLLQKWGIRFDSYLSSYPVYNHINFLIHFVGCDYNSNRNERNEFSQSMVRLLTLYGEGMRTLDLKWGSRSLHTNPFANDDYQLWNTILKLIPNVSELKVELHFDYWEEFNLDQFPRSDFVLYSVTKLTLDISYRLKEMGIMKLKELCKKLIELMPNVKALVDIGSGKKDKERMYNDNFEEIYLQELASMSVANKVFPYLDTLQICSCTREALEAVLKLRNPIRRMDFGILKVEEEFQFQLMLMVDKHKDTLEMVGLEVIEMEVGRRSLNKIRMPDCPKLNQIMMKYSSSQPLAESCGVDILNLRALFESGPTGLSKRFPCLRSIRLISTHPAELGSSCFFADSDSEDSVFPQITELVSHNPFRNEGLHSTNYKRWTRRMETMFPKANTKDWSVGMQRSRLPLELKYRDWDWEKVK